MRAASWLTGAVLAAALAVCAPARAREVVRRSDSRIKAQVEEALKADETLSGSRILRSGRPRYPCRISVVVLEPSRAIMRLPDDE